TANPVLKIICSRLAKQERKHFAFYYQQAERRLNGDRFAQRLTKFALESLWKPVGMSVGGGEALAFVAGHLFADDEGKKALVDADQMIAALPGTSWFGMIAPSVENIVKRWEAKHGRAPIGPGLTKPTEAAA